MGTRDDPRFLRSRQAILDAVRDLLLRGGPAAVTHARVAEEAGIGRATVYRHWPRVDQLLTEAMATVPMPFFAEPTTPTRAWIRESLVAVARQLELDAVRVVATTLANAALWDRRMNARREKFARVLSERLSSALEAAEARGEVRLHVDSRSAAALLLGPLYYRSTIERSVADGALVDAALASLGAWTVSGGEQPHEGREGDPTVTNAVPRGGHGSRARRAGRCAGGRGVGPPQRP